MVRYNSVNFPLSTFALLSMCFLMSNTQTQGTINPEVTIPQGSLRGGFWTTSHGRNVLAFWGIPYAQPPIGNLRFANPIPADGWSGIRDASVARIRCPQMERNVPVGQEDCLYLDVYTPQLPKNTNASLVPVMVNIHGGEFERESSWETVNPHFLLNKDVIMVSCNYRLGPLGFLSTGDEVASGNWGLKDQILALKWVQSNIKYFGGDPDQVTLFGISAGGALVHLLTLMDATDGLFHKYITQSGSALASWAYQPIAQYAKLAFELGEYVACSNDSSNSLIDCLRTVDALDIVATYPRFFGWHKYPRISWSATNEPDIEGAVLTESPANLFAAGKIRDLPWITGVVRDEGLVYTEFYSNQELFHDFLDKFDSILPILIRMTHLPNSGAALVSALKSFYLDNDLTANASVILPKLTLLVGDALFNYPVYSALRQQFLIAKNPQYFYNFHYLGALSSTMLHANSVNYKPGVMHADDSIYIFLRTHLFAGFAVNMTETDLKMSDILVQLWTSFAIDGTPSIPALNDSITWDPYSSEDNYLRIGNESDLELAMQYSFYAERMQFWANLEATLLSSDPVSASSTVNSSLILFAFSLLASELVS